MVTMGIAPIKVLHYYYSLFVALMTVYLPFHVHGRPVMTWALRTNCLSTYYYFIQELSIQLLFFSE